MINSSDILNAKVLIVDDLEANVRLLDQMLRNAGYASIASTMDPHEVCELHHKNRYDLILLDLQMPGMDGFQVMEGLKEIETDGYLPVLVITAEPGHKLRALQAGAKDFISKPFDLAEVRARVYNMLEVRLLHMETKNYSKALLEQHNLLQRALLPGEPHITSGYQLATKFIPGAPGKYIGGDFYDVFETEDGRTAILIGDVSGKGVESAAMAAATRSTVRAFAYDSGDPAQALDHTNVVISQSPTYDHFATAFLAVLDPETGRFTYSSAAHPPAMVRRADGTVDLLNNGQLPIGVKSKVEYQLHESRLAAGDQLVMYTDGISEARKGKIMLNIEGIQETLAKCHNCSPDETLEALFEAALEFGGGHLVDDAAVVIIERRTEVL